MQMTKYILIYVEMGCEYRMEEIIQGKHFSITDPPEVNTVIYQVNKTPNEEMEDLRLYIMKKKQSIKKFNTHQI